MQYKFFRKVVKFLKESNLVEKNVNIRRCKLSKGFDGLCELKNDTFLIRIDKNLPENHSVDVLIHEFAHAVAWGKDADVHGPNWGKSYSKVYRLFLEKFLND
jgi:hypothetical protein